MSFDNESLTTVIVHLQASRYITVSILLYDHFLTFSEEVELIWRANSRIPKILFLFIRYIVPIGVILHSHQLSGIANTDVTDALMLGVLSIGMGNFLVMLHVWNLWERRQNLIFGSLILFAITQIANLTCGVITVINVIPIVSFSPILKSCTLARKTSLVYIWAPGLLFELAMFSAVFWNAASRPRTIQTEFSKVLHRDGIAYFALSLIFLAVFFVWCSTTVTVSRLVLQLRRVSVEKARKRESDVSGLELKYVGDWD
ncbi:hypothetical protein GYMLUDRAFT_39511 [Collybiopsis luxurians FD-317 M1]|nr:hypothetical protein GYMLUDRAFT_39511 [Collybiopsis luxurians FD-317 M1]